MALTNTASRYGLISQTFHWTVATLVIVLFVMGKRMESLKPQTAEEIEQAFFLFSLHKTLGLYVLVLAVLRVAWMFWQPRPRLINADHKLEAIAAHTAHWLLYILIFAMPLTGWLQHSATQGLAPIWAPFPQRIPFAPEGLEWEALFGWAHNVSAMGLLVIVALHVAGALKHAIIDRDGTLRRMIPGMGGPTLPAETQKDGGHTKLVLALVALFFVLWLFVISLGRGGSDQNAVTLTATSNSQWQVVAEESTLGIQVTQSGAPTNGFFGQWTADISFDPNNPQDAQVMVEVDVNSLDLGGLTSYALGGDYLRANEFTTATFKATDGFKALGENRFETTGNFELMGISQPLTLTFDLNVDGDTAKANGEATILRLDYGVGLEDPAIGLEVFVSFDLTAKKSDGT